MKYPKMEGVGTHLNINPKDNDFMIKVRELVDNDPELLGNNDIMKFVKLACLELVKMNRFRKLLRNLMMNCQVIWLRLILRCPLV